MTMTGRFATRGELVLAVWHDYLHTKRKVREIAAAYRVSVAVVNRILTGPRPKDIPS